MSSRMRALMADSFSTASSASRFLNSAKGELRNSASTSARGRSAKAAYIVSRLEASGRFSGSYQMPRMLSDLARWILRAMVAASSVRLMRDMSDASDLLILRVPSRSDITRVASPAIIGSGRGK